MVVQGRLDYSDPEVPLCVTFPPPPPPSSGGRAGPAVSDPSRNTLFSPPPRPQVVVQGRLDYSDPEVQRKVEYLLETFENSSYVEDRFYTESWLRDWVNFVDTSASILDLNTSTPEQWLDSYKTVRAAGHAGGDVGGVAEVAEDVS